MWAIDHDALGREIDKKAAAIDAAARGRTRTRDTDEAIHIARLCAEHDALVTVFNCLREHKSIWSDMPR
jgi:trehalose/maltose hydrolase-like predicted phosphorylase